ncbi:MAG: zinc ribbon domain-containing protein [Candidatus Bathyarchaeota archaeon]|nr:zinc ribbon domain-containing protein [Candidatus Bathyarchaeota archaeon]
MTEHTVKSFMEGLANETLKGSKCTNCSKLMLPPRPICPSCGGKEMESHEFNGEGTVKACSVIHIALTRFQDMRPHCVGIVWLKEGVGVSGLILSDGKEVEVGSKVEAVFLKEEDRTVLAFKPV